jgi:DNA-binding transcriptional LysR family regulator
MDIQQLRTFYRVAQRGSVTAAARELGYTQSAVSRQISALEASIEARLFDRRARGVRLTEHGQCLLPHAESLLARLDAATRDLADLKNLERGVLRVGAFATANAVLIPHALAAFRREHPNISLSLVEGSTHRQLAWLEAGEVDVAVVSTFPDQRLGDARIDLVRLLDDTMLVAVPRSHHLARRRRLRLRELVKESWIAADPRQDDRLLSPVRLRPEYEPVVDFVVREWTAKLGFVAAGLGITLVPSLAARAAPADVALVALHPEERSYRRIYAATAKGRVRSPATDAFHIVLRDAVTLIRRSPDRRS